MDKKAQALSKFTIGLSTFLGALVLLAVLGSVLTEFADTNDPATLLGSGNETYFANVTTAFNLTNTVVYDANLVQVRNNSNLLSRTTQYTVTLYENGVAQINFTGWPNASDTVEVGVNYTYRLGSDGYAVNASRGGQEGLVEVANLSNIMGLLLVLGLLLMLLFAFGLKVSMK